MKKINYKLLLALVIVCTLLEYFISYLFGLNSKFFLAVIVALLVYALAVKRQKN
jgi:hypothetical protein